MPDRKNRPEESRSTSLSRRLVLWFLLISLLPLSIVAWVGYQAATDSLTKSAAEKLIQSARLNQKFINTWMQYRFMDINYQAENRSNAQLLMDLKSGWHKSGKPLEKYIKSYEWTLIAQGSEGDLAKLNRRYDYIYDIFLMDEKGNILYTVAHEPDLGTNLFSGPYANTQFAKTAMSTLATGETKFSDMERYSPSDNLVAGFLTAPLLDKQGKKLGVFAIQIKIERIVEVLKPERVSSHSLVHYIVGEDGILRSPMNNHNDFSEILSRKINSKQFDLWFDERHDNNQKKELMHEENDPKKEEEAFSYIGPNGKTVIGIHNTLELAGVNWVLISEIDEDEALASANWLAKMTLALLLMTILFVVVMAIYQARRITRPIVELMNASLLVSAGKTNKIVEVKENNEIGKLAEAFNYMVKMRQIHVQTLEKTNAETRIALAALDEQRFAMDQHAIVAVTDVKGNITFVNDKFTEISGYTEDELLGQNHRILNSGYHDRDFFVEMYKTIANGNVWHNEVRNRAKNGEIYWVDSTIVPFMGDDNKPRSYIVIRTDITKQKKIEEDLLEALSAAEVATQLKSDFLANMSHEIRTPMNGVIGMTNLLLGTSLSQKQRDYAETTMKSADALLTIINDILDFSKIEAGKLDLEVVPFDLRELAEDVSELMALKCREKNIEMLLHYKSDSFHHLLGDPGRIRQILLNLLSNAIKFTEEGHVLLSIESFGGIDNTVTLLVKIEDCGIGIEQDKLEKIFNKFDQEDGSTTRKFGGTGLGLAICRELCGLMNGVITVHSEKGKGSTFSFTMSLEVDSDCEQDELENYCDITPLAGAKLLVIDEVKVSRTILADQLSHVGMEIELTDSVSAGFEKLSAAAMSGSPFDIVIADFSRPEMKADLFVEEIQSKALLKNGVLVYNTSYPKNDDGKRLKDLGFDAYLTKPMRSTELSQILSLALNAKRSDKKVDCIISRHSLSGKVIGSKSQLKLTDAHVLLTEDNPVNQMVATEYLEGYGCTITPAGNGLEAVEQVESQSFDLIFMDCQMPEMDGFEATKEIRQRQIKSRSFKDKNIPIIAFTANAMQGDREHCLAVGMDDFISKPVNPKAIEAILTKWLPSKLAEPTNNTVEDDMKSEFNEVNNNESQKLNVDMFNSLKKLFESNFPELIEKNIESSLSNINIIEAAIKTKDFDALERAAHSIKGASGQFGAIALSDIAAKVEQYAEDHQVNEIKVLFSELKAEYEEVSEIMLARLDSSSQN